ncbi:MAG: FAD-dependent oxidoreductase [Candidatus Peribacteraceae bacterium]|nr:FAD-dependent oxidoreductase [Candidatus Peribacteraceae bacterium]
MYDVIIIGLGIAGYTAAIYNARYKLNTFLVGAEAGGMGNTAAEVGNWPGEIEIRGPELMDKFKAHAESFKDQVTLKIAYVKDVMKIDDSTGLTTGGGFRVLMEGNESVDGKTIIFATGSNKRHLGIPGETEFAGKGVTYCATCDAFFYKNKTVAVIGGGDSAVEGAAIAAQVAAKVYLVHRKSSFRAEPFWVEKVKEKKNVEFVLERNVLEILGDKKVTGIKLDQPWNGSTGLTTGGSDTLAVDGVFIEIGSNPAIELPKKLGCEIDALGFLKVDEAQRASVPGVFGAGDLTSASNHFAQFTTAAGEATVAANSAFNYLQSGK